jgi:ABC-2 type transport system ATP-binding protein
LTSQSQPFILEVRNLGKSYGDFALHNLSFALPAGYIMGFIGPNGAGKTTTIKAILNFISYSGEVRLFNQGVRHGNAHQDNLGTVPICRTRQSYNKANDKDAPQTQNHQLRQNGTVPKLSAVSPATRIGVVLDAPLFPEGWRIGDLENAISPFYPQWDSTTFASWLKRFELPVNKKVGELSRGMKTKLSLAVALSHNAELLILDEPTSGLDPGARDEICQVLREFVSDEHHSVLFSTHITQDLERTADLTTFILGGRLTYSGPQDELLASFRRISGGAGELSPQQRSAIIGYRESASNFEGLVKAQDAPGLSANKGLLLEPATLDEIFVFCERQSKAVTRDGALS